MNATYSISDVVLRSAIALPELTPVAGEPDWSFALVDGSLARHRPHWFQRWRTPSGRESVSFARRPDGYLLRFHRFGDFAIDLFRRSIVCAPRKTTPRATVRHLLLDQVIPLVMSRDARLVLHASAVATPGGAIAFVGRAGSGKSTLAAALAATGFPLLADDCLVVEPSSRGFVARPFYPGARLWPDSARAVGTSAAGWRSVAHYSRKRRIAPPLLGYREQSAGLIRVFVLDGPPRRRDRRDHVTVTRLRQREALLAVLECSFHLDSADPDTIRRRFELQGNLVHATPVYRLSYPWRLADLGETRDALVRRLEACESS